MNSSLPKDNYSLLNEEKKAKIMQDLRDEIDKRKSQYSLNESQLKKNMQNNSIFNSNDINIKNLNLNENETEKDDDEDEEHMEILNNAKNVLSQIQNDINKFTKTYGLEKILPKNKDNNNDDIYEKNYSDGSLSNSDEEEKNVEQNERNENDDENINYLEENEIDDNNQYNDDYNNNDNFNIEDNENNYEINYNNNIINNFNYQNQNTKFQNPNKNKSIKLNEYNQYNNQKNNNQINYQNESINNDNIYESNIQDNNNINKSNYTNINYSRYNFDNPLGYDNDFMKKNITSNIYTQYQNNIKSFNQNKLNNNINSSDAHTKIKKNKTQQKKFNKSSDNIFAQKNREKFLSMKKELEDKFAQEHPFKPKINKSIKKNKNKILNETEQERYNRLSRPKILDINEKKKKRDLEELKKISELNTIKPTYKVNPKEVSNRLYNISNTLKQKKDKIKQSYEESQNKEYSFVPEINPYSKILMDKYEFKPIYERNEDFEKNKLNNIIRKRQEIEKEQKQLCKPKINSKSKKIVEQQKNVGGYPPYEDIYEKLYRENINKDTKNLATRDLKECTFTPKVNPISNLLVSNNNINYNMNNEENMKDFLERQKMYEDLRKKKLEKNKENNNYEYTFKPEINSNSDLLVKCNPERFNENQLDKYSRLYQDAQRIKIKKEKLENELNNKYDFTPKINELSKYIGRKPDFDELNLIKEKLPKDEKKEEEYDFTPELYQNSKYKNIKSNYKNDQGMLSRINEEVQNKKEKIETLQKMKENDDISKFNFTPEINKDMPDFENNKPMYMKGMARYLNQMEKARQAKRDKEQREKEVFITGEGWNKNNGITVPKPFKLSYQNNPKKENIKEENKECNFKIKNNENKNREIIKKLLNGN